MVARQVQHVEDVASSSLLCLKFVRDHGRQNQSRRCHSHGTNVEAKVMNFIISNLSSAKGSADSEIIQSVNLNVLRVREQDAGRKGTRCCA